MGIKNENERAVDKMRQYIESVHYNGEVKEKIWNILDSASIVKVVADARKRNCLGYNRAWRIEEDGKIIEAHCDPSFWQYLNG